MSNYISGRLKPESPQLHTRKRSNTGRTMRRVKGMWITWECQRRNHGISTALGWNLYQIEIDAPRIIRYLKSTLATVKTISKNRPDVVVVQNPSILLSLLANGLKRIFHFKVVMDAHNSGIYPFEGRNSFMMAIAKWLQRESDLTIITNKQLKEVVEANGGNAFILPDKIPNVTVATNKMAHLEGKFKLAYICSFSRDEPYPNVIQAARLLSKDIIIYVTGKYDGKVKPNDLPDNIRLQGFLPEDDYWSLLKSVDIVMDLTLRDDCLVCGAYEALALGQPMVLSNTIASRAYFSSGCVYVDPSAESIADGIMKAIKCAGRSKREIVQLKTHLILDWEEKVRQLKEITHQMVTQ